MNDKIVLLLIALCIIIIILFGCFSYNAIDNLADSLDSKTYKKSYLFKGIGSFIYSIIIGLVFIKIFDLLILKLQL